MWSKYFFSSKDMTDFSEIVDEVIEEFIDIEK